MAGATPKWFISYMQATDPVAQVDDINAAQMARLDILLGEQGTFTSSPVAGTTTVVPITLTRTYSGNNTVANQCGIVILSLVAALPSTTTFNWWTSTFTGSTSTITGFSFGLNFSATQASRVFVWRYFPSP